MKDIFTHLDSNLLPPQAHECIFFSCVVLCVHAYLAFFLATSLIATPTWFADGLNAGHNFFFHCIWAKTIGSTPALKICLSLTEPGGGEMVTLSMVVLWYV